MKENIRKALIIMAGILLNAVGRLLAQNANLPVWLDTFGTVIATYYTGLPGGLITAAANNIIAGFFSSTALVYIITSVAAAFAISIMVKKGCMNNALKAIISSFCLGIVCAIISMPLNLIFYNGYSGNVWGDTLVDMLLWYDAPLGIASLAGEAVVDIVDKQICFILAYIVINVIEVYKKKKNIKAKNITLILAASLACSIAVQPINAQASEAYFSEDNFIEEIYNNANGMVSSEANVICETNDGYIWIGSYAGLTRYDGSKFEFIREGGLVNVVGMMNDSRGRLWIGTNDAGIARYENGRYTYFTVEDGLPTNSIRCFAEDKNGCIYVGTSDRICRFNADDEVEVLELDITFVKSMVVHNDILVAMNNNSDIYAVDMNGKLIPNDSRFDGYSYYSMALTSRGLILGTETGELFVADVDKDSLSLGEEIDASVNLVSAIFEDSKKRIWIAADSGFGFIGENSVYQEMQCEGFDSSIDCILEDYQGNIWISSSRYGVMKLSESPFINIFEKNGAESQVVNAVECYKGYYFCGTDAGLVVFDNNGVSNKFSELVEMTDGYRVRSIMTDSQNNLWLCTYNGLICYGSDKNIRCYNSETDGTTSDRFRCIDELKDGTIVTGTADGINFIKNGKITGKLTAADGLGNTQILTIVENSDGTVWAGSDGSGIYVISDGKLIKNYTVEDGLSSDVVLRIVPHDGGYFIVTSNSLCYIDENGNIKKLNNFPYFNNYDVIIYGETAYIPCSAGLYKTEVSELCNDTGSQIKLFGASEGLLSGLTANSWNYVSENGRLYLCSNNGVIIFNDISEEKESVMKYGLTLEYDGTAVDLSDSKSFTVPANVKELSLTASVRNYSFSDVKVSFFIRGLDEDPELYDWDDIEPIRIYKPDFTGYSVSLRIFDGSGEKLLMEDEYTINKEKRTWEEPFYRTYLTIVLFELILVAIISIISVALFVIRKNELEKARIMLENKVDEQTNELIQQQKKTKELFLQTVTALSEAVDAKDRYTSGHSKRVAEYSRMIAARLGKSKEEQEEIYRAGLLHDVGKIRIPVEIINKAGKLTDEEYDTIKIHPVTGYHILRGISGSRLIAIAAKYHHERYDGRGYPNGLVGDKIPQIARILGVADSYDAMTSNRSYRNALPQAVVRSEIEKGRGTQFDPEIADIMLRMIDEDENYEMKQEDSLHYRILTIDDEIINHKLIAHIMKDEPMYEIVSANGGSEALQILSKQVFDLILLDVMMPDMDGLETLKLIREKYQTPVVLMTGDKTIDTLSEFSELGCDDYITKPVLPLLIKEIVHNMTQRTNIVD